MTVPAQPLPLTLLILLRLLRVPTPTAELLPTLLTLLRAELFVHTLDTLRRAPPAPTLTAEARVTAGTTFLRVLNEHVE